MTTTTSTMQLKALALASCAAIAAAYPTAKTCVTQAGSDSLGVPIEGTSFTAMGSTWTQVTNQPSSVFSIVGGKLRVTVPSDSYGLFAISNTANVSNAASTCTAGCDRLVCFIGAAAQTLDIVDTSAATCEDVRLVVGYAVSSTEGKTLQFAKLNTCDPDVIQRATVKRSTTMLDRI